MKLNFFGIIAFMFLISVKIVSAQVLNESAAWPNTNWSITGTYNVVGFDEDPTVSDKFSFDDDNAGSGSSDDIAAESPIIDLTAAFNAGETWLVVNGDFVYNWYSSNELLAVQYWNADASAWVNWHVFPTVDTPGAPFQDYCSGTSVVFETTVLNIAAFTTTQLSGFKYRLYFDDNITSAAGWDYGFCFNSPTISSQLPPTCAEPSALTATNVGGSDATISWQPGSTEMAWEYVIQPSGTGVPSGNGTPQSSTTVMESGLSYSTTYEVYVRADCATDGFSDWVGPLTFTTTIQTDFSVDCAVGPITNNFCYFDDIDDDPSVATFVFTSTDGSPLWLTFNSGSIESCCDELVVIDTDGTQLFNDTVDGGNLSGLSFQSSGDTISFYINSDVSVSCESGSYPAGIDYTVACATCTNPQVTYDVVGDCQVAQQFYVEVDVTDLGSAPSLTLSDNQASPSQTVSTIGLVTFGPYPNTTDVVITVVNDSDANCTLNSNTLTQEFCQDFVVDCAVGPITNDFCYFDDIDDDPSVATFQFTSSDGTPLRLTFNSGSIESCCDELVVIDTDGTEIFNDTIDSGDLSGMIFQSTGDTISFYINSDVSISCESGSYPDGINYTVSCATCINPEATYAVVDDCDNGDQFYIDVNITNIGDATSLTITDNQGSTGVPVTAAGVVQMGPYPFATPTVITISNDQDPNCVISSAPIELAACPPDNDNPCDATMAVVNSDFICAQSTPGTLLEATPSGVPNGSCAGNPDDDVWFQFVANSEYQLIALANLAGSDTFNIDHALYEGTDCNSLQQIACAGTELSSITPQLVIGNTYFIRVFSGGGDSETTTFDLCITPYNTPSNVSCELASNYCNAGNISTVQYTPNVVGMPNSSSVACLGTIPNPVYNILVISSSGDILIEIVQNTAFDSNGNPIGDELDVDYVLWGPFDNDTDFCDLNLEVDCPSCPNNTSNPNFYPFGNIVDCSYSANAYENITMEDAIEGQVFLLLVTNFDQDAGIIQITQTNYNPSDPDVGTITGAIDATIENPDIVDSDSDGIGDVITVCQDLSVNPSVTLTANSPFADSYQWYLDGFVIDNESSSTLEVTQTNNYILEVYDEQCATFAYSQTVQVNLFNEAVTADLQDIVTCDDPSGDEQGEFDLESQTADVLAAQNTAGAGFAVTYHLSLSDAQAGVGALTSPYTNVTNPQTIWVRVEDLNAVGSNSGCFATDANFSFDLIISGPTPTVTTVDYSVCDDSSNDEVASFDLTSQDALVLGTQNPADFTVSYYLTEAEALAGTGALASPYTNISNPQTLWVRVESNASATCFDVGTLTLNVTPAPNVVELPSLGSCDSDGDLIPDFDLTTYEADLINGQTGMTVTYHTSQNDADTGDNAIGSPNDYSSNTPATIYVRIESAPDCYNTTNFELMEGEEPVTTITSETGAFEICDNATIPLVLTAVPDNYDISEVSISWYQDGAELSETSLILSVLTGGYYEMEVVFNDTGCTSIVGQEVITLENCVFPQGISPNGDGYNDSFDLSSFDVQQLEVFNRYGALVYSQSNYTNQWHGQSDSGDELPVGTYFYAIKYQDGKEYVAWVYLNR